ncbi:hypothetical protein ACLOJK_036631, partial [Asimina triloba]
NECIVVAHNRNVVACRFQQESCSPCTGLLLTGKRSLSLGQECCALRTEFLLPGTGMLFTQDRNRLAAGTMAGGATVAGREHWDGTRPATEIKWALLASSMCSNPWLGIISWPVI